MRVRRWLLGAAVTTGALALAVLGVGATLWARQGQDPAACPVQGVTVEVDAWGIPTVDAPSWEAAVEAQGWIHASQRLFQMDLQRRMAAGRLSEWFGPAALDLDRSRREQDWPGAAEGIAASLADEERTWCEAYARGVNRFIEDRAWGWGLEYLLLRERPDPWSCVDSGLVLLAMADQLSNQHRSDLDREPWLEALPPEWAAFLYTLDHPWGEPFFGHAAGAPPLPSTPLPRTHLDEIVGADPGHTPLPGSNSWAWVGRTGSFLANDPHLGQGVPQTWYANRLRVSEEAWVVGVSLAGIPGVVLGMNPHLAWAFTNTGEDVDDLLDERVDGDRYLHGLGEGGEEIWEDLDLRSSTVLVAGAEPVEVTARYTSRGPLVDCGRGRVCSRQWLPLVHPEPGIPTPHLNLARDVEEVQGGVDRFTFPAQNILVVTRQRELVLRISGTGVVRRTAGDRVQPALEGAWEGLQPPAQRPWLRYALGPDDPVRAWSLATANQRMWVDPWPHRWNSERRAARIREVLASRGDWDLAGMASLQLDTCSPYHRALVEWLASRAPVPESLATWDGCAEDHPVAFARALEIEASLEGLLLGAVRHHLPGGGALPPYSHPNADAWILSTLAADEGLAAFGLEEGEVAAWLLERALTVDQPYTATHHWEAQHPFVGRVPVAGEWFRVQGGPLTGYDELVRVERPTFGASMRTVWSLSDPAESTWAFPVGQSGHVRSRHYDDLRATWRAEERIPVFPDTQGWGF